MNGETKVTEVTEEVFNNALAAAEQVLTPEIFDYGDRIAKLNYNSGKNAGTVEGFLIGGVTIIGAVALIKLFEKLKAKKAEKENSDIEEVK